MREMFISGLILLMTLPQAAHCQVDSFSVVMTPNYKAWYSNLPENYDASFRGANYNVKGFLYPGNYFEEHCPEFINCGIVIDTIFDGSGDILELQVNPEDPTIVIGDWDCRSFIIGGNDIGATDQDEVIGEIACQTFDFYAQPDSPCPEGCYIVTEGLLDRVNTSEGVYGKRSLTGGTMNFRNSKGDLQAVHIPESNPAAVDTIPTFGRNQTGGPAHTFKFAYSFLDQENNYEWSLNVSTKQQSLIVDGPRDSVTGLPGRGAILMLSGVVYDGGVLDANPNGGLDANGHAEYDSIGTWTMKGTWTSSGNDLSDGLFLVNKQYFELAHPVLGHISLITDSESEEGTSLNEPLQQLVIGGTGQLMGQTGESTQTIIGQNASGGWNLSYTFETSGLTDAKDLTAEPTLSLQLFPNPTADQLTVKLENIQDFGTYALEVTNMAGQRVLFREFDLRSGTFIWNTDVSAFANGWYGLVLKRDGQVVGSKGFAKVE